MMHFCKFFKNIAFVGLCLAVTACGEDEPSPFQEGTASTDTLRDLEDLLGAQPINPAKPAQLRSLQEMLDFSKVELGNSTVNRIVLANEGDDPLTIDQITLASEQSIFSTSGSCRAGTELSPTNRSCFIEVTFVPQDRRYYESSVIITHSAEGSPLLVTVKGEGHVVELPPEPVPEMPVYVPPPAPRMPSELMINAQRLQSQRSGGRLQVLQTPDFDVEGYIDSSEDYSELGYQKSESTYPVNRERMITADRFIPAVLENHINSQIPDGRATAVIESHVYSAQGRHILIPGGSRAIGQYGSIGRSGETRMEIVWLRIIRPDGAAIDVQAPAADIMGRQGISGYVDERYFQKYGIPLLVSTFGVALNYALSPSEVTQITGNDPTSGQLTTITQETLSREAAASRAFTAEVLDTADRILQENVDIRPIVTIPGGTRFVITPTRDLAFKRPTLLTSLGEGADLAAQARQLIDALQRGDLSAGSVKLAEVLGSAAQFGVANEGAGIGAASNAPVIGGAQFDYGPPPDPARAR